MKRLIPILIALLGLLVGCNQPQTVSLATSPSSLTVKAGEPAQVIRATTNASSSAISWSLSPQLGSLNTTSGLEVRYLPPKDLESDTPVTITASLKGSSFQSSTTVLVKSQNQPTLSLSPSELSLTAGDQAFTFTANLQNTSGTVTWTLSQNLGELSSSSDNSVQYTPPATLSAETAVTLTARLEGSAVQSTSLIALKPKSAAALSISPRGNPNLTLRAGSPSQTFKATLQNTTSSVVWALSPNTAAAGSIKTLSNGDVEYLPPASVPSPTQVTLTASLPGSSLQDSIHIVIEPLPSSLSISPSSIVLLAGGGGQEFTAQVQNSTALVNWSLEPSLGSLSTGTGSSVVYTPPSDTPTDAVVNLVARLADGSAESIGSITVRPRPLPTISLSPSSAFVEFGGSAVQISATTQNTTTPATINWSLSPNIGQLTPGPGNTAQYTPPPDIGAITQVNIQAQIAGTAVQSVATVNFRTPSSASTGCSSFVTPLGVESIVGYTNKTSYLPGESIDFRMSVPSNRSFAVSVYKDGASANLVWFKNNIPGQTRSLPAGASAYSQDINWPTTTTLAVPAYWTSGIYFGRFIDLGNRSCYTIVFTVKRSPSDPTNRPPIAVLASDFHWQAYNRWGGASFYDCASNTCGSSTAPIVSLRRPISRVMNDNIASGTRVIAQWLAQNGYAFDVITDSDLHSDAQALNGYNTLILPRHSEYWSGTMRDRLDAFLNQGHNLLSLGGNQIYWKIAVVGDRMEVRKESTATPHTLIAELGGLWRYSGVDRPEARVLGNRFTAYGMGVTNLAPYRVIDPNHWALAGTGLQANQTFGAQCSGWETDKIDPSNRPAGLQLIAQGTNIDTAWPGQQAGADMVYYQHGGGGGVFSVGSLAYFSDTCRNDPTIARITRNVLDRFLNN